MKRSVQVGRRANTRASAGRTIPLNATAYSALVEWCASFPDAKPEHYLFPSEKSFDGDDGRLHGIALPYDARPDVPLGSWKVAWTECRKRAGVKCRLHDLRHTFISRLAASGVSDQSIIALAGWMSKKMLERYSHAGNEAKRSAVETLDAPAEAPESNQSSKKIATVTSEKNE